MGIVYDTEGQTEEKEPEQTKVMCEEGEKRVTVKKRRVKKKNNKQTPHLQKKNCHNSGSQKRLFRKTVRFTKAIKNVLENTSLIDRNQRKLSSILLKLLFN